MRRSLVAFGCAMVVIGGLGAPELRSDDVPFLRGDVNSDGVVSISDALMIRRYLFTGGAPPTCYDTADVDDSSNVNITDQILILNALFLGVAGAPAPAAPFPAPGLDPNPDNLPCAEYQATPPEATADVIRIGEVSGGPGADIEIPVYVTNANPVDAFQIVLRYDPEILEIAPPGQNFVFEDTYYDENLMHGPFAAAATPEEGVLLIGFVPSLIDTGYELPPGEEQLVFKIKGRIPESAPLGAMVEFELYNGESGDGYGPYSMRNELTNIGSARLVTVIPKTINGVLEIVGDITIFRGDSNDDGAVDISDATFTLSYLFTAGDVPACPDAADANDDGRIDVSDPVTTLWALFQGQGSIAPPYPSRGYDTTPDDLGTCFSVAP